MRMFVHILNIQTILESGCVYVIDYKIDSTAICIKKNA